MYLRSPYFEEFKQKFKEIYRQYVEAINDVVSLPDFDPNKTNIEAPGKDADEVLRRPSELILQRRSLENYYCNLHIQSIKENHIDVLHDMFEQLTGFAFDLYRTFQPPEPDDPKVRTKWANLKMESADFGEHGHEVIIRHLHILEQDKEYSGITSDADIYVADIINLVTTERASSEEDLLRKLSDLFAYPVEGIYTNYSILDSFEPQLKYTTGLSNLPATIPDFLRAFTTPAVKAITFSGKGMKRTETDDSYTLSDSRWGITINLGPFQLNEKVSSLGPVAIKIFLLALGIFTQTSPSDNKVNIDFLEFADMINYNVREDSNATQEEKARLKERRKKAHREIKSKLSTLKLVSVEVPKQKHPQVNSDLPEYREIPILHAAGFEGKNFYIEFHQEFVDHLKLQSTIMYLPKKIFSLSSKGSTAFRLAFAIYEHYSIYKNHIHGTEDVLSVKSLLHSAGLPRYKELQEQRIASIWNERIKDPFENALESLHEGGLITNWEYEKKKGIPLTDEEAMMIVDDYRLFESLNVRYSLDLNVPEFHEKVKQRKLSTGSNKQALKKDKSSKKGTVDVD